MASLPQGLQTGDLVTKFGHLTHTAFASGLGPLGEFVAANENVRRMGARFQGSILLTIAIASCHDSRSALWNAKDIEFHSKERVGRSWSPRVSHIARVSNHGL
jgi:hypothetical protein